MNNQTENKQTTQTNDSQENHVKYDPQQAYFDRMNSTQRSNMARRQGHQFADSIGGCSANYRW